MCALLHPISSHQVAITSKGGVDEDDESGSGDTDVEDESDDPTSPRTTRSKAIGDAILLGGRSENGGSAAKPAKPAKPLGGRQGDVETARGGAPLLLD